MTTTSTFTLEYLEELKAANLSQSEGKEALEAAVRLCQTYCKEGDVTKAEKAFEYAKYWGDDKNNEQLFKDMGAGIEAARQVLKVKIDELQSKADVSFLEKRWSEAKEAFTKLRAFFPNDADITAKLKEIEIKLNPPAAPTATDSQKSTAKKKRKKVADVTLNEIGEDITASIKKLEIYIAREQKTGRSVARAVKAAMVLRRMVRKQLLDY